MPTLYDNGIIPDNSITTPKIADGNVTPAKLSSSYLLNLSGPFSAGVTFRPPHYSSGYSVSTTINVINQVVPVVKNRAVLLNFTKDTSNSGNMSLGTSMQGYSGQVYPPLPGSPGNQFNNVNCYYKLSIDGIEIGRWGYESYTANSVSWNNSVNFNNFSFLYLPSSTKNVSITLDFITGGTIDTGNTNGDSYMIFTGTMSNCIFEMVQL